MVSQLGSYVEIKTGIKNGSEIVNKVLSKTRSTNSVLAFLKCMDGSILAFLKCMDGSILAFLKCMDGSVLVSLKCMNGSVLAHLRFYIQSASPRFPQSGNSGVP